MESACVCFFRKRNIHARMKFEYLNQAHRTPKANQLDRAINCVRLVFTPNWKLALEYLFLFRVWAQMKHIHKTSSPLATHTRLRSPTSLYAQLAAELLLWGSFPPQGKLQYPESNKFFTLCTPWNTRPRPVFPRTTPSGRGLTCCAATNRTGLAYFRFVPVRNEEARSHREQQYEEVETRKVQRSTEMMNMLHTVWNSTHTQGTFVYAFGFDDAEARVKPPPSKLWNCHPAVCKRLPDLCFFFR